mmetsp:Transcript_13175/g.18862  ORF Transcript_13175/g.18862 Transcript_13175/m.18862 type:complete len:342 (+) Transcript_13175:218-1243(+)
MGIMRMPKKRGRKPKNESQSSGNFSDDRSESSDSGSDTYIPNGRVVLKRVEGLLKFDSVISSSAFVHRQTTKTATTTTSATPTLAQEGTRMTSDKAGMYVVTHCVFCGAGPFYGRSMQSHKGHCRRKREKDLKQPRIYRGDFSGDQNVMTYVDITHDQELGNNDDSNESEEDGGGNVRAQQSVQTGQVGGSQLEQAGNDDDNDGDENANSNSDDEGDDDDDDDDDAGNDPGQEKRGIGVQEHGEGVQEEIEMANAAEMDEIERKVGNEPSKLVGPTSQLDADMQTNERQGGEDVSGCSGVGGADAASDQNSSDTEDELKIDVSEEGTVHEATVLDKQPQST